MRRSISLQITRRGELVVKAPLFIPLVFINHFVSERADWINKHISKFQKIPIREKIRYEEGEKFMYLGNTYLLHIGNVKTISVTDRLNFPQFLKFRIQEELTDWYIRQAKDLITSRVIYHAKLMNAQYKKIYFSDTISKWGSCSRDNILQFNWRLIMTPILVIDYVVVHELAHTTEKNHGIRFWNKVALYKPAYKQYRKWLNTYSHTLMKDITLE